MAPQSKDHSNTPNKRKNLKKFDPKNFKSPENDNSSFIHNMADTSIENPMDFVKTAQKLNQEMEKVMS